MGPGDLGGNIEAEAEALGVRPHATEKRLEQIGLNRRRRSAGRD